MPGSDVFNLYTTPLVSHTYTPVLTDDEVSGAVTRDTSSAPGNAAPITQTFTNPLSLCPAYQVYTSPSQPSHNVDLTDDFRVV